MTLESRNTLLFCHKTEIISSMFNCPMKIYFVLVEVVEGKCTLLGKKNPIYLFDCTLS